MLSVSYNRPGKSRSDVDSYPRQKCRVRQKCRICQKCCGICPYLEFRRCDESLPTVRFHRSVRVFGIRPLIQSDFYPLLKLSCPSLRTRALNLRLDSSLGLSLPAPRDHSTRRKAFGISFLSSWNCERPACGSVFNIRCKGDALASPPRQARVRHDSYRPPTRSIAVGPLISSSPLCPCCLVYFARRSFNYRAQAPTLRRSVCTKA